MKKFFVTNLIFMLTLNIFIKSFWILGIDRGVQNALSCSDYGTYYALINFTYLFNIILDLGLTSFNTRLIARHTILLPKYFAKIIPLKLLLAGIYSLILLISAFIFRYDAYAVKLLLWLIVFQVMTSMVTYLRSNISALLLFKTDSFLSVLDKTLVIILCSVILWTNWTDIEISAEVFIYIQVFSLSVSALTAFVICLVKSKFVRFNFDFKFMITVLKQGFPYALLALLMSFYNRTDSVMLERLVNDNGTASGIYASGFRLVDSVNMVAYLFSVILLPLFSKMIKENQNVKEIIRVAFHLLLIITSGFITVSLLYSNQMMDLMYNKHIKESADVFRILCFCFFPVSMTYIFGTLLTANGSMKQLNIVASVGMVVNIGVNLLLIPEFKEIGSATASLISQSITAFAQIILALKIFKVKIGVKYCLNIAGFILSIAIAALLVNKIDLMWIYKGIITLIIIVLISFIFKILDLRQIKDYFIETFIKQKAEATK